MSLRILVKPSDIQQWITDRDGKPARKRDNSNELGVLFNDANAQYEGISLDELFHTMRSNQMVMLVDQEPGKTFHNFIEHA